jgi:hypothetical protein
MGWFTDMMNDWGVSKGDLLRAGVDLYSGMRGADATREAARMQSEAAQQSGNIQSGIANRQIDLAREMFNKQLELAAPFRQSGLNATNRLSELLGVGGNTKAPGYGSLGRGFTMKDFEADPGYAFRLSEGLKSLDRQAAARGGLISATR